MGLSICVVSLHGPTLVLFVVLILWSAVLPCAVHIVNLRQADGYLFVLRIL